MEKSAQVIEQKGVVSAPLRKRVRKSLKIQGLDEEVRPREKRSCSGVSDEDEREKPQPMLTQIYGCVNSKFKKEKGLEEARCAR